VIVYYLLRKVYLSHRFVSLFVVCVICQMVVVFARLGEHKETAFPGFLWQIYQVKLLSFMNIKTVFDRLQIFKFQLEMQYETYKGF